MRRPPNVYPPCPSPPVAPRGGISYTSSLCPSSQPSVFYRPSKVGPETGLDRARLLVQPGSCNSGQLQVVPWARGELFGGRAAGRPAKLTFVLHKFPHLPPLPMAHRPCPSRVGQLAILRDEVTRFENACRQHLVPTPAAQPRRVGGCSGQPVSEGGRQEIGGGLVVGSDDQAG